MNARAVACAAVALAAGGCISKSVYLKQVDEAVQARARADACDKRLRQLGDVKGDLEEQVRTMDKRRAMTLLDFDKCREQLGRRETESSAATGGLKEELRKSNDQVNELRAKLAAMDEQVRGAENKV